MGLSDPGAGQIGDIDTAVVVPRFENGALGVIDNSRAAGYGYECSTEVMGRKATVRIDHPQYRHYEWLTPGQASRGLAIDFEQRYPWAYAAELGSCARCVAAGRPKSLLTTPWPRSTWPAPPTSPGGAGAPSRWNRSAPGPALATGHDATAADDRATPGRFLAANTSAPAGQEQKSLRILLMADCHRRSRTKVPFRLLLAGSTANRARPPGTHLAPGGRE